jgi:hypothetical protein
MDPIDRAGLDAAADLDAGGHDMVPWSDDWAPARSMVW